MSLLGRFGALAALALAVFLAAGCGGTDLDASKMEDQLQASIENTQKTKVSSVDCPSGVAVEPQTTFSCSVRLADGSTETATVLIRDKDANTTLLKLQPDK
jgi:chromosome condensin MukBEF MukE localization factor